MRSAIMARSHSATAPQARLDRCRAVIARLAREGRLRPDWDVPTAARLMWSASSQRAWEELVVDQGWSTRAWVKHTTALLEGALTGNGPTASQRGATPGA